MRCAPAIIDLRGPPWPSIFLRVESFLVDDPTAPAARMFTRLPYARYPVSFLVRPAPVPPFLNREFV